MNVDNIKIILDHYLDDEIINLTRSIDTYKDTVPENTKEAIRFIENYPPPFNFKNHIAYNLLKLKLEMEEEISYREKQQKMQDNVMKKITRSSNESHL